ncbi:MAG: PAS domain S-box protein [Desulfobacterales bacterium]|nr:PAS domain S-box protein [Desulfobacterales bacterium]
MKPYWKYAFNLLAVVILSMAVSVSAQEDENPRTGQEATAVPVPATMALSLAPEESAWLRAHPIIRVHNEKDWPPFNYFEFGRPRGLSIDYMNLVAAKLGIEVEYVTGPTWNDFLGMLKRKELDVMLNTVRTEDRLKYMLFTEPYARNPNTIVSTQEIPYETLEALDGKTVSFPAGFFIEEVLAKSFPRIKRLPVENTLESLKAVMFGQADAALAESAVAQTLITDNLLAGLQLSGELDLGDPDLSNLRLAVRNDWPLFHAVLMKAMAAVTPEEMTQIRRRWVTEELEISMPARVMPIAYGRLAGYGIGLFLFICLTVWILIRGLKREQIAVHFGSRWFRGLVIAGLSLFVIAVGLAGGFTLERNKAKLLAGVTEDLTTTIKLAHDRLKLWVSYRTSAMRLISRDPDLVVLTDRLLAVPASRDDLLASAALRAMRHYFETQSDIFANIGFFIINPDYVSIGSMRDTNVGTRNLIADQRPDLVRRAFAGEFLFVPPIDSDVSLGKGVAGRGSRMPSTKFFMGPIRSPGGDVMAVMTLRVDPSEDLTERLLSSQTRASGETYVFNDQGIMLSESRFDTQLRSIGLVGEGQTVALNLAIRDPGVNLVAGERPPAGQNDPPLTRMASRALAAKTQMEVTGQTYGHSRIEIDTSGYRDYRGVPVFGAWLWDNDLGFGLAAEIDVAEAMAAYHEIRRTVLGTLGFTLFLSVGAVLMVLVLGERASRALLTARDDLEARVDARTTELQEKQVQLAEAEERARLLLDSAGEGIFGVDVDGRLAFINPAGCRMLGYEPDELIGEGIHDKVHYAHADGSHYPREECPMYHSFTEGTSSRITDEVLWRQDGAPFPVEYTSTPIQKDGQLVGAVVTFADITERKSMEAKLADEQKRLQRILDTSPVAAGITVEGVIQYANARLAEYFGLKEGDQVFSIYINPEDRTHFIEALERTGEVRDHELKVHDAKGEVREMLANYNLIEYEGRTAVLGWWTDITDIKATSEALKTKFDELARFRQMAIGRELKMIELKKEINAFFKANGAEEKYKIH